MCSVIMLARVFCCPLLCVGCPPRAPRPMFAGGAWPCGNAHGHSAQDDGRGRIDGTSGRDPDPQDRHLLEAYCADMERILSQAPDASTFQERAGAADARYLDAWFAHRYGSAHADPMQAFRRAPVGGVVRPLAAAPGAAHHPGRSTSPSSAAWASRASELYQRHAWLLEGCPWEGLGVWDGGLP